MSAELLAKLKESIEEDDGLLRKSNKKKKRSLNVTIAQSILTAANRGQVELGDDEKFLVERKSKKDKRKVSDLGINVKRAHEGYSLINQIRDEKPKDLKQRNIRYMKFMEKRKLDEGKVSHILKHHFGTLSKKDQIRAGRDKITCLRDPKKPSKAAKAKGKSVFSDKDFASIAKEPKALEKTFLDGDAEYD
ncbi:unnamed protein product [Auanema sp. JU1783]|nr:unnamed protein product [Auanema sp. JU1783]